MSLICPACFLTLEYAQLTAKEGKKFNIPMIYYTQLLGLAQGLSPEEVGLQLHKIKLDKIIQKLGLEK